MFPFPRRQKLFLKKLAFGLFFVVGSWLVLNTINIISVSSKPADAFFVLGGSISREIYVAELAKQYPQTPILISHGSPDPCIVQIFRQLAASQFQNVWLEKCADSTFGNFYYGIPILRSWGVRKVKLITSNTHVPRAKWMAQILLGAHGIWVEPEIIHEEGIPGNHESWLKTGLDVTRSLLWAGLSQITQPQCSEVTRLTQVNLPTWQYQGFKCERQKKIRILESIGK
ncbi:MAG: YdcF family protein [Rhizonema sp. PD37]|nr:YdcF family protein [Rhizonema sp. PD37]